MLMRVEARSHSWVSSPITLSLSTLFCEASPASFSCTDSPKLVQQAPRIILFPLLRFWIKSILHVWLFHGLNGVNPGSSYLCTKKLPTEHLL